MSKKLNLIGEKYDLLTVIKEGNGYISPSGKKKSKTWMCKCQCGNTTEVRTDSLKSGNTKSCGCKWRASVTKHGHCKKRPHSRRSTMEYSSWQHMKARCHNPNHAEYSNYGGRGITICDEWKDDFQAFYNYIGKCPIGCNSIDRINVNGNYEPGNVRWSNPIEQARNQRNNKITEEDAREIRYLINIGETIKTIANLYNVSITTIYDIKNSKTWVEVAPPIVEDVA